ncbi:MAG: metallophosphoesterase [Geobacteraceae bacterium]|nr:metallophosphoesterase [Geobacteraceae bacterium]
MSRFLIFYFVAYGGSHLYLLLKIKRAFPLSGSKLLLSASLLTALFLSPLIARKLESSGFDRVPEIISLAGYTWMGLLFLFVTAAATIDLYNVALARTVYGVRPCTLLVISVACTIIVGLYGYYEAANIRLERVTIKSSKILQSVGKVRIVQISDLHIGQIVREKRVKDVVDAIRHTAPDMIVSTGDLVDGHQKHFSGLELLFQELKPRLGKYAILGNHEYYVGINETEKFIKDAGFRLLVNENFESGGGICITGMDDSKNKAERLANVLAEKTLLDSVPKGEFKLLLKHRPVIEKSSEGEFDLQLSGHVHKGQIFPFNLLTWISFPVRAGLTEIQSGSHLYVSRGTGVWGPPIRFLAPPEVTVIDLYPDK